MEDVFVLSAVRTPIGKYGGGLAAVPAVDLAAKADSLRGGDDRLQPAAAQPVEGEGGRLDREAAIDSGHAGEVHVPHLGVDHVP